MIALNIIIIVLILLIVWWFWIYQPKSQRSAIVNEIDIRIAGGVYTPDTIYAQVGKPLKIRLLLQDKAHCAKTVIFSDFNLSQELEFNQPQEITLTPDKTGEFGFNCPMNMYSGKIIVEKGETIDIKVDGGVYKPDTIYGEVGVPIKLRFIREDLSHCAATVVFPDFSISQEIDTNTPTMITIHPEKAGTFNFGCPMGMYQGKLIINASHKDSDPS